VFWPVDPSSEQVERLIADVLPQLASSIPIKENNRDD
jgi:hypothetical protein